MYAECGFDSYKTSPSPPAQFVNPKASLTWLRMPWRQRQIPQKILSWYSTSLNMIWVYRLRAPVHTPPGFPSLGIRLKFWSEVVLGIFPHCDIPSFSSPVVVRVKNACRGCFEVCLVVFLWWWWCVKHDRLYLSCSGHSQLQQQKYCGTWNMEYQ